MASAQNVGVFPGNCTRELSEEDFLNETEELLPPKNKRFASCSEKELDDIESLKDEKNTKRQTVWGVKILKGEVIYRA